MNRAFPLAGVALFGLAACVGKPALPSMAAGLSNGAMTAGSGASANATLVLKLPPISLAGAAVDWSSSPQLLSSATQSVTVSVGKRQFGPFALSASSTDCAPAPLGLDCTLTEQVRSGRQNVTVESYATASGTGKPLAVYQGSSTILPRQQNVFNVPMTGIAQRLGVGLVAKTLTRGQWAAEGIVAVGIDAAQRIIPSTLVQSPTGIVPQVSVYYSGFVDGTLVSAGNPNVTQFGCCGVLPAYFEYDGVHTGTETFTLSAQGYRSPSVVATVVRGSSRLATLLSSSVVTGPYAPFTLPYVQQFTAAANGNVAPVRAFVATPDDGRIFGEDHKGSFWVGGTHYSNSGRVLGVVPLSNPESAFARDAAGNIYTFAANLTPTGCSITEYDGSTFSKLPLREITYPCADSVAAVDGNGDIFAANSAYAPGLPATISEYPAGGGSGAIAPSRVITLPAPSATEYSQVSQMDCDASGNLYVLIDTDSEMSLSEIAPGSATAKQVLTGVPISTFSVADDGTVYVRISPETGTGDSIEVFPAGETAPSQTIAGSLTELSGYGPVVVPRAWTVGAGN